MNFKFGPNKVVKLKNLTFSERLVLVSVRLWVKAYKESACTLPKIRYLYTAAGVIGATITLDTLLQFLSRKANEKIEINCPNCTTISRDENSFLGAVAIWQAGQKREKAEWFTRNWLSYDDNLNIQKYFAVLAHELKDAHFLIRPRNWLVHGLVDSKHAPRVTQTSNYIN